MSFKYPSLPLTSLDQKYYEPRTFPPPDESNDYIKIGPETNSVYLDKYHQLLEEGYNLNSKYGGLVRGHYLPVWVQVNKIKKENPYKIIEINGKKFAQMIGCLDTVVTQGYLMSLLLKSLTSNVLVRNS